MLNHSETGSATRLEHSSVSNSLRNYVFPVAIAIMAAMNPACKKETNGKNNVTLPSRTVNPVWDSNQEYSRKVNRGEFSKEEYSRRLEKLSNGEQIFNDIGSLTFYRVVEGDSIQSIYEKLVKYKQYEYLKNSSKLKIKFFNVPNRSLTPGMLIPIPLPEKDRSIPDEQFLHYSNDAINEMLMDKDYGSAVMKIISKTSKKELLALMLAIAKQESGGQPIGQFELHRWEPRHGVFSFSIFHIMMKGPGIKARKKLNLTEGQLYHPKNAAKLLLAYLCEKTSNGSSCNPEKFFPVMDNLESLARSYNGKAWRHYNPNYIRNISRYYREGMNILNPDSRNKLEKKSFPRKGKKIGLNPDNIILNTQRQVAENFKNADAKRQTSKFSRKKQLRRKRR
jgi:hypothetical protein